jgi:hypothetical protein
MLLTRLAAMSVMGLYLLGVHPLRPAAGPALHWKRMSASDLEVAGMLNGAHTNEAMFVRYDELLTLPQETYTVSDDPNFKGPVTISGVALESLPKVLGASSAATMITAVCNDAYSAHYPPEYLKAHHAVLVLKVNGKPPDQWPVGANGMPLGPYMISHPNFKPSFQVLAHQDEPQVPSGVVRLEFVDPNVVYAQIDPVRLRLVHDQDPLVLQGYAIARQNCFRCHGRTDENGTKSSKSWEALGRRAAADPKWFDDYVRNPKQLDAQSEMVGSPEYDAETMKALRAYFILFAKQGAQ